MLGNSEGIKRNADILEMLTLLWGQCGHRKNGEIKRKRYEIMAVISRLHHRYWMFVLFCIGPPMQTNTFTPYWFVLCVYSMIS